ncbi:phosphate signaling complex PhoU family protein, partial [Brevibacterium sp. UCMA 11754]|uniref:phosphate signaling complex PhoU family protein n=1 Tax=Brevibacterium sp. UCMA 11754 TaxID=2749198 RepID=UPI002E22CF4A
PRTGRKGHRSRRRDRPQQYALDQQAAEMLALQAPVAADLRAVLGSLRMSASLERMGDLARHIAQQVRIRYPESAIPDHFTETFTRMANPERRSPRRRRTCCRTRA